MPKCKRCNGTGRIYPSPKGTIGKRIQKILQSGIKENLTPEQIVERILADTTHYKKKHDVSIHEYEELLRESKQLIQESRKLLYKCI